MLTQFSRLSHHTITDGITFSIPTNEDFTTTNWTNYDLALSEIGVDELNERVFIRVGNSIKEFQLSERTSKYIDIFGGLIGNTVSGTQSTLYSVTLPGGYFEDQTGFYIRAGLRTDSNNDPKEFDLRVNDFIIYSSTADIPNPSDGRFFVDFDFIRNGTASISVASVAGSSQISLGTFSNADFNVGVGLTGTFSWNDPIDIQITASASNIDDVELFTVKVFDIR